MSVASVALDWIDPVDALAGFEDQPYTLLLYGGGMESRGRYSYLCAEPAFTLEERDPVRALNRLRASFRPARYDSAGFEGGYAGLLAYDLGRGIERALACPPGLSDGPVLAMGWYEAVLVFDHAERRVRTRGEPVAASRLLARLERSIARSSSVRSYAGALSPVWTEARYLNAVEAVRDYVRAGDVFQVNLSQPFRGVVEGESAPYAVFQRLARDSAAAFSAWFRLGPDQVIVTNSPERFVRLDTQGRVQARPIKGTRPRRADPAADRVEAEALACSEKDRAENLMIVDLMRNDLSRISKPGSVICPQLFAVESFTNVHHLVSVVEGELQPGRDVFDLIEATFPPGSITGAPKVRAMEIIAELEGESRGAYCGALGWIAHSGAADFNVMIRTAIFVHDGVDWRVEVRSGGAITIDSNPRAELEETHAKAAALKSAIEAC